MSYVDYADYQSSPTTADPFELLAVEQLRTSWLKHLLAARDVEIAAREAAIAQLIAEAAE
jgi:hypothetical protein